MTNNISQQWEQLKRLVNHKDAYYKTVLEQDLYKGTKKNTEASIRARNKLNDIRKLCETIRKDMLTHRKK